MLSLQQANKIRSLIIDDDSNISHEFKRILLSLKITKSLFTTSENALDKIASGEFNFLVMDYGCKGASNIVRTVRKIDDPHICSMPIIAISRIATSRIVEEARDAGVTEFVIKPISTQKLDEVITSSVLHPRTFIISRSYVGPDRRRHNMPPPDGIERRKQLPPDEKTIDV